ncbi:MAG TPA: GNAT family N-acetyltransferase [Pilimelia sp.]|nr:GNAT family N-acetyltransferase [Pilimelia sp.]
MEIPRAYEGEGVVLRPYQPGDVPRVVAGCGDPLTQRYMPAMPRPYDADVAREWVAATAAGEWETGRYNWAVADPVTDVLWGGAGLRIGNDRRGQAEVGYWVCPDVRGRGVATAATRAMVALAFAYGLHRVELITMWENTASQRVALAAGFRREGERRGLLPGHDGRRHDALAWYRLVDDEPAPPRVLPDLPGGALTDGVVTLRPLAPGDVDVLHVLRCQPDVVARSVPPRTPERADTARRCARAGAYWLAGERADLLILAAAGGEVVGELGLYVQEPGSGQAMLGIALLPRWRGRGFAARATALLARWAFGCGIARLVAGAAPDNIASQRTLERVGFRREGYAHARLPGPDGGRVDDVGYALLPDWLG